MAYRLITHCRKKHLYDSVNTYVDSKGHRHCRACWRVKARERAQAKKPPPAVPRGPHLTAEDVWAVGAALGLDLSEADVAVMVSASSVVRDGRVEQLREAS